MRDRSVDPGHGTVTVVLPKALLALFPEAHSPLKVEAGTVDEMFDELEARWPGIRDRIRDSRPSIRRHINVFVDGDRATLDTRLPQGAEVYIMTAISGGDAA